MARSKGGFLEALASSWALLAGFGILMLGDGLQGTLLPVRAGLAGFSATLTGLIMSAFYVGFLLGSLTTPWLTVRVGHVRVFAAFAAISSTAILVHALFVTLPVWIAMRLVTGFCFAGLYIVAESWLNDRASNETRGSLLSLYMLVTYLGVGGGQLLLNLAPPDEFPLFILTSILISIAVVPLLLSAGSTPAHYDSVRLSLLQLYRITPLGVVGMFVVGLVTATFFALGPVYAQRTGLDIREISYFMTAAVIGILVLQAPLGILSDRFDRRLVLTGTSMLTSIAAVACIPAAGHSLSVLFVAVAVLGGLAFPLYSICIAYANDHLDPSQMIAASGALVLTGGIGAIIGPVMIAALMDRFGDSALFWSIAAVHGLLGLFAFVRIVRRPPVPLDKQGPSTLTAVHPSGSAIDATQHYARDEYADDEQDGKGG